MKYSVTQFGKELSKDKYSWNEKTKTFSSEEDSLVLDFKGLYNCTFKTGSDCTFKTGYNCTFKTGYNCTFDTSSGCTFDTSYNCTFDTSSGCTFDTSYNCTFDTSSGCVVVRRDFYEIIELKEGVKIRLNGHAIKGYTVLSDKTITIDSKYIKLSNESYEELKKHFTSN